MNHVLYSDWARKQMSAANYRMDKIRKKRKKRTNLMLKVIIPVSISFITILRFYFSSVLHGCLLDLLFHYRCRNQYHDVLR